MPRALAGLVGCTWVSALSQRIRAVSRVNELVEAEHDFVGGAVALRSRAPVRCRGHAVWRLVSGPGLFCKMNALLFPRVIASSHGLRSA